MYLNMDLHQRGWLGWATLFAIALSVNSLSKHDMFDYGEQAGDQLLEQGTDQTQALILNQSMFFFDGAYDTVYINTNGFLAVEEPKVESEYLGKMPASFGMIAIFLGDLDNSDRVGKVYYRQDSRPSVLLRTIDHISQAFPQDDEIKPTHALIITWENVVAHGEHGRGDGLDRKRNTFQLVVASMASASYAILFYPREGLQYISTPVAGQSVPVHAGFSQGLVQAWFSWSSSQGPYYRITTDDEASVRQLSEETNSGRRGVWVYEIGTSPFFSSITPGLVTNLSPEEGVAVGQVEPVSESPPRNNGEQQEIEFPPYEHEEEEETPEPELPPTIYPVQYQPRYPVVPESPQPSYPEPVQTSYPEPVQTSYPEPVQTSYPEPVQTSYPEPVQTSYPETVQTRYSVPVQPAQLQPPRYQPQTPQVVVVDEDDALDVDVFAYSSETCASNRQKCSSFADCKDYTNGYCCHCRPGFYGNGKDCVAEGKPQRMNGKVSGRVFVGNSPSPLEFYNNDLHSYVVANDGRAYVAISTIPAGLGPSLQPLSSLGGVIGWAFALEQPGYENGFSIIGGVFSRLAEVTFLPGNERLTIKQEFKGVDEHDHLVVSTELEGRLPEVPHGSTVQIDPYKELYQYGSNRITSSSNRDYTVSLLDGSVQTKTYQWRQTITYQSCPNDEAVRAVQPTQQLSVDQIFVMYDSGNQLIRYAMSNKIGSIHGGPPEQNPCFTGRHGCDTNAACRPGEGVQFTCKCSTGFTGDGRQCYDIDECRETPEICGSHTVCNNQPGTFRCECVDGFQFASNGKTCVEMDRPIDHCQRGTNNCDIPERARCSYTGASAYICSCLSGFVGDGHTCQDIDECEQGRCHQDAVCYNAQGSFTCQCRPGFHGDGFQCAPGSPELEKTQCERDRESIQVSSDTGSFSFFRPRPAVSQYVPTCDQHGAYEPTQCHGSIGQCWCVDGNGQEVPNTRTGPGQRPLCIDQGVIPPPIGPTTRPDVSPVAPGTHLLFAQSGKIEHIPLDGYSMNKGEAKALLHLPDRVVIAVAYDCVEKMVYWTDITGPSISKASLEGGDIISLVTTDLESPEGLAIDYLARLMFWTDSMKDRIEVAKLDGSQRRVLFDTDLVNPRPIVADPSYGRLYWADWNRDGPKIEMSNMDGTDRTVLVKDDLGLPNGLTYDPESQQLCWADAGTRKVQCMDPNGRNRRTIVEGIQYPFAIVSHGRNLYYTDWRREAVVAVDRTTDRETDEFLPQKRSRVYGIATTPTQCTQAYNYCSNNGGCSHLCLPRRGGFTCRCPDVVDGSCVERNL
ncbi:nidogen-1-like [Oncorhynchus tshawytscha]|uniref:Nidogen-1-like n=1 Tax=Oncorhynchus tshawytscha TaxID=74940 RepID=A0A8C8GMH3_ONCTS|nr:nidogen-1-like [Oncorhynchus tshawytscha]